MLLKSALISACLLASAVLADDHSLRPRLPFSSLHLASRANTKLAGEALALIAENGTSSVSAAFKLPALSGKGDGRALITIGLDIPEQGSCSNTLVSEFVLNESVSPHYTGRGYFSDNTNYTPFSGLSFSAGEKVTISVTADNATSATIIVNSHSYKMTTTTPLCASGAYFGLAAYPKGAEYYPLPKFGTFAVDNAKVTASCGTKALDNGANVVIVDMTIGGATVVTTSLHHGTVDFTQHK